MKWTIDKRELLLEYINAKLPSQEIADKLGISIENLRMICSRNGFHLPRKLLSQLNFIGENELIPLIQKNNNEKNEKILKIKELLLNNYKSYEIAIKLGISKSALMMFCSRNNISLKKPKKDRKGYLCNYNQPKNNHNFKINNYNFNYGLKYHIYDPINLNFKEGEIELNNNDIINDYQILIKKIFNHLNHKIIYLEKIDKRSILGHPDYKLKIIDTINNREFNGFIEFKYAGDGIRFEQIKWLLKDKNIFKDNFYSFLFAEMYKKENHHLIFINGLKH